MQTLIISDLHLGSSNRLPNADGELVKLLNLTQWKRIIFLGDMFDLWVSSYADIIIKHPKVIETINHLKCEMFYIPGNHDSDFRGIEQLNNLKVHDQPLILEIQGKRVAFFHGDIFDPSVSLSFFARILVKIASSIDNFLQKLGSGLSIQRTIRQSLVKSGRAEDWKNILAEQAVNSVDADIVIVGHTHIPDGPRKIGKTDYVNSGDFGPEHLTWAIIADSTVQLHDRR